MASDTGKVFLKAQISFGNDGPEIELSGKRVKLDILAGPPVWTFTVKGAVFV
jgi:hypothetical protein